MSTILGAEPRIAKYRKTNLLFFRNFRVETTSRIYVGLPLADTDRKERNRILSGVFD